MATHEEITDDMLSPYNKLVKEKFNLGKSKGKKLICNLLPKKNYLSDFRNIKFWIQIGVKVTKVHEIYEFEMDDWLAPFIKNNNEKRKEAEDVKKNEFEGQYYKLANNSIFGKTIENIRKRIDFHLSTTENDWKKRTDNIRCTNFGTFNANLFWTKWSKKKVKLDKPIQVGSTILDLSKLDMYKFYYGYLKPKYGDKVKLLAMDTDSFIVHIFTDDLYKDMYEDRKDHFDMSNFPEVMYYANGEVAFSLPDKNCNLKVTGMMKAEYISRNENGIKIQTIINEFIGLCSKLYSFELIDCYGNIYNKKTAKGVKQKIKDVKLGHELYKYSLEESDVIYCEQYLFKTKDHNIYTVKENKRALCPFDDKRYVLDNGKDTLAYGHYRIPPQTDPQRGPGVCQ